MDHSLCVLKPWKGRGREGEGRKGEGRRAGKGNGAGAAFAEE